MVPFKKNSLFSFGKIIGLALLAIVITEPRSIFGQPGEIPPYFNDIQRIMAPLEYSGLHTIIGKDASLQVDFDQKKWTLLNAYHYDSNGRMLLDGGKRGLCGQLSRYMYDHIKPLFAQDPYKIRLLKVKEKGFFNTQNATHIVLSIADDAHHQIYLLDPSFKAYARMSELDDYIPVDQDDPDHFFEFNTYTNKEFQVDLAAPLLIRNDYLITFSVESLNGVFDKNHFVIALAANHRNSKTSIYLCAFGFNNGHLQIDRNQQMLQNLLTPQEVETLVTRIFQWFTLVCIQNKS